MPAKKKTAAQKKEKSVEESLWQSANSLRGSVESAEYKHVVLSLIFLKFVSDKFEAHRQSLIERGQEKYLEMSAAYAKDNVFYLPETSRWSYIKANAKQDDLALKIDSALKEVEKTNKPLQGALPDNYFSRLGLNKSKLSSLIDQISGINTIANEETDIIGRVYEYFLKRFAIAEGKGKGEFYTPKNIVNLIASIIEPYEGIIYDPCCGSGGMFVQSLEFIKNHQGNTKKVSIYGQEQTSTTYKLAKMNLAIRGITANFGKRADDTFFNDQHPDLKADYIMANPPFNQNKWRAETELVDDPRWDGFAVPPKGNANYGWILHMISKLSSNGMAGFILANGALKGDGEERKIRQQIIEKDLLECIITLPRNMFYSTDIGITLWILNANKARIEETKNGVTRKYKDRSKQVLFVDLRTWGSLVEKKFIELDESEFLKIVQTYRNWKNEDGSYLDVPEYCQSARADDIAKNDYSFAPSRYVKFVDKGIIQDYEAQLSEVSSVLEDLLEKEAAKNSDLESALKGLGYGV